MGKLYKKDAVKLFAVYWYWYTVHARSLINYVLSLSIPNFQKIYTSEILYETESSFKIMLFELKMSGK